MKKFITWMLASSTLCYPVLQSSIIKHIMADLMKCCWCVILFFGILFPGYSQSISEIDSLNDKAVFYRDHNNDTVYLLANQALELSQKINYTDGEINALTSLCFSGYLKGTYEESIEKCTNAIDLHSKTKSTTDISGAYLFLGLTKVNLGKYDEAISHFMPLIELATKQNNDYLLSDACSNIGLAYLTSGNYTKAKEYYGAATKIHKKIDHPHGRIYVFLNMGRIFFNQTQYDSALYYLNKTYQLANDINNERAIFYCSSLLGQIPREDKTKTEELLLTALSIAESFGMERDELQMRVYLMENYFEQKKYKLAEDHAIVASLMAETFNDNKSLQQIYNTLVRLYAITEDIAKANMYIEKYELINRRMSEESDEYLSGILGANEMLGDEREYEVVKSQLEAAQNKIRQNNIVTLGVIITLILIAIILLISIKANKAKSKNNKELHKLNDQIDAALKEKDILLGMVVHDLRSPMSKIQGLTDLLKSNSKLPTDQLELIEMIQKIVKETKSLAGDLLEVNQLDTGKINKQAVKVNVKEFINEIVFHYQKLAHKKSIKVDVNFDLKADEFETDKFMLQRIIENLVSNAIKFNTENGLVKIDVELSDDLFTLSVKDDGLGIPENEQKFIFKKFGKTSNQPTADETSTGLGLYIVQSLVNDLKGIVSFVSKESKGTEFTIKLPAK